MRTPLLLVATLLAMAVPAQAKELRTGTVFPIAEIPLMTQAGGKIVYLKVEEGDRVKSGQLLLNLDTTRAMADIKMLEAQLAHRSALRLAQISLDAAKRDLARDEALFSDRNLPAKNLEDSRHRMKLALEQVNLEQNRLSEQQLLLGSKRDALKDLSVEAPATGILATRFLHENQVVSPGSRLGELLLVDDVYVEAFAPLAEVRYLKVGRPVPVHEGGATYQGRVKVISEKVDPVSEAVKVKLLVPNPKHRLKPGMLVKVLL